MMQLQLSTREEVCLESGDVERMRRAFAGLHVDPKRHQYYRIHLESGQAFMTDGARMHTIPVRYSSHTGVDLHLDDVRQAWARQTELRVEPDYSADSFLQWQEIVPKADLGMLCDIDAWLPVLAQIRGWGWTSFQFYRHDAVVQPVSADNADMALRLPHLMYKGKNVPSQEERIFNPQFIYDVFYNAKELGDNRVFLCLMSQNATAPLLCRGNNSAFLALVRVKK